MTLWGYWNPTAAVTPVVEPTEAPVYALAGERVTCTRGHYICTLAKDIRKGDFQQPGHFKDWCFGEAPTPGVLVPPACQCGAIWWRSYDLSGPGSAPFPLVGFQFHFENRGWQ